MKLPAASYAVYHRIKTFGAAGDLSKAALAAVCTARWFVNSLLALSPSPHVPIRQNYPALQHPFDGRLQANDFPCPDALKVLHHPSRRYVRMSATGKTTVILVRPNHFHLDRKLFLNLGRLLLKNHRHCASKSAL